MNAPRDPDRLIHGFVLEGAERLHDRVYDAIRAEIDRRPQRVVIGPWRMPVMNKLVPIGLGAAAAVVAVVLGVQALAPPAPAGPGGPASPQPSPTPTPTATSQQSAEPSASADTGQPVGSSWKLMDEGGVQITATIPAPGWFGDESGVGVLVDNGGADPPDGAGIISFAGDLYVYRDPCAWTTTKPDRPSTTVDELVAALTAQASRDTTPPVDVTVGGYAGKSITLHVPEDAVFSQCDGGLFGSWQSSGNPDEATPSRYHQGPGQVDQLWLLDVGGVLVVIDTAYYATTPAEHVEQMRTIVESAVIEVP